MIAPATPESILPLELLQANEEASIVELVGEDCQIHRLEEMGLRVGASIRMVRPGLPCLLALDGKRLSIRLSGIVDILVSAAAVPA